MTEVVDKLCALLKRAGAVVTIDAGRNFTHPCTFCATTTIPRSLMMIGKYLNGDDLERPVCFECIPLLDAKRPTGPQPGPVTITKTPGVCGGRPLFDRTRIWPSVLWSFFEEGHSVEAILGQYPTLTRAHVAMSRQLWREAKRFLAMRRRRRARRRR